MYKIIEKIRMMIEIVPTTPSIKFKNVIKKEPNEPTLPGKNLVDDGGWETCVNLMKYLLEVD
ncbi:MAG TPA: hypothetical protein VK255_04700 [Patescibacteria group bacterium]|nr:hypothetical protein [Patescibacteria group bacterium]